MMRVGNNEVVKYVMMSFMADLVGGGAELPVCPAVDYYHVITNAIFAFYSGISTSVVGLQLFSRTSV